MKKLKLAAFIAIAFGQSAYACIGDATSVRYNQILAVNEAVRRDYSVDFKGIESLLVNGDEVIVKLSDYAGNSSVRTYKTIPTKDSGPLSGNCDKVEAILVKGN